MCRTRLRYRLSIDDEDPAAEKSRMIVEGPIPTIIHFDTASALVRLSRELSDILEADPTGPQTVNIDGTNYSFTKGQLESMQDVLGQWVVDFVTHRIEHWDD